MNDKKLLIHESCIVGIFAVVLASSLFFAAWGANIAWQKNIKKWVSQSIEENFGSSYKIGDFVTINSPIATSSAVYSLEKTGIRDPNEELYAVVVRCTGMSGAVPLLYIVENGKSFFAGVAGNKSIKSQRDIDELIKIGINQEHISFWEKRSTLIVANLKKEA